MTTYRLSTYPQASADYLRLYREADLTIKHASQTRPSSRLYQRAIASIKTEHVEVDVLLETSDGAVAPDILKTAEEVMSSWVPDIFKLRLCWAGNF